MTPSEIVHRAICAKIREKSYIATARALGLSRATLGTFVAGAARPGTVALVEQRARALGWVTEEPKHKASALMGAQ